MKLWLKLKEEWEEKADLKVSIQKLWKFFGELKKDQGKKMNSSNDSGVWFSSDKHKKANEVLWLKMQKLEKERDELKEEYDKLNDKFSKVTSPVQLAGMNERLWKDLEKSFKVIRKLEERLRKERVHLD